MYILESFTSYRVFNQGCGPVGFGMFKKVKRPGMRV